MIKVKHKKQRTRCKQIASLSPSWSFPLKLLYKVPLRVEGSLISCLFLFF